MARFNFSIFNPGGFQRNNKQNPHVCPTKKRCSNGSWAKKRQIHFEQLKKMSPKPFQKKEEKMEDEERTVSLPILRVWQQRMGCRCLKGLLVWSPCAAWFYTSVGFSALWGRLCLVGWNDARSLCIVSMYGLVAVTQVLPGGGRITLCNSIELLCDQWFHHLKLFCLVVSVFCCACTAFYAMFRGLRVELPTFLVMAPRKAGRLKLANPRNWGWRQQV